MRYRKAPSSRLLRQLHDAMRFWPHVLIVVFLFSPVGPHIRFEYTYRGDIRSPSFIDCTYLGSRGFINATAFSGCPFFAWLDTRDYK